MKLTITFEATTKETEIPDNKKTVQQVAPIIAKAFKLITEVDLYVDDKILEKTAEIKEGMKLVVKEAKTSKGTKEVNEENNEEQYEVEYESSENYEGSSAYNEGSDEEYSG